MTELEFLGALHEQNVPIYERAVGLLWWAGRVDPTAGLTARTICEKLEATGLPKQNSSRLNGKLVNDCRTSKAVSNGERRLHPRARSELNDTYKTFLVSKPVRDTSSVLPTALVEARGYLVKVVTQLNASYDAQLYDCCAVMCRRTLETLIIEVYEHVGRADEIKGPDGHFHMFSGLLRVVEHDKKLSVGRNAMQGLRDFKKLGDLSAHNRRFNARQDDIDRVRDGLRIAVEELAHLAGFRP
ncbi:MAG: hypothetical protein AB7G13_23100 [Lautropia sp.]